MPQRPSLRSTRSRCARTLCAAMTVTAAAASLAVGTAAPAAARDAPGDTGPVTYRTVVTDPDDTAGPLDVARVVHTVRTDERAKRARISFRVRTFSGFAAGRLHPHRRSLVVELDTDGGRGATRNLRISARDGEPVAELISNATRKVITALPISRPNSRTIVVNGARKWLGAREYFWTATYHRPGSRPCGRSQGYPVWCQDSVPERGWIRMDRPAWPRSR